MDINSWLTVITVFMAVLAFFPKEERKLLQYKLHKAELAILAIALVFVIPYLILFPSLIHKLIFLKVFTVKNGIAPSNIAFGIFFILFIWILLRLFVIAPRDTINRRTINYFVQLLTEVPFTNFFSLFRKYTPENIFSKDSKLYAPIFFNPVFLKGVAQYQPEYLYKNWNKYNTETDFKKVFNLFITDLSSPYYTEIKLNSETDEILGNAPFLHTILVKNLKQSIENRILPLVYDTIQKHLQNERSKPQSIYRLPHEHQFISEEEGYDLPVYYHVKFIGLMYNTAIYNKIDIGNFPNSHKGHMHTLYPEMVAEIIKQIPTARDSDGNKTNYLWLIDKIFDTISDWLEIFGGQHPLIPEEYDENDVLKFGYIYFDEKSTYLYFIPRYLEGCFRELCKGFESGKILQRDINSIFDYNIMRYYWNWNSLDAIRTIIEEEVITKIPRNLLPNLFDCTLDRFVSYYSLFEQRNFRGSQTERDLQARLWNTLNKHGVFDEGTEL